MSHCRSRSQLRSNIQLDQVKSNEMLVLRWQTVCCWWRGLPTVPPSNYYTVEAHSCRSACVEWGHVPDVCLIESGWSLFFNMWCRIYSSMSTHPCSVSPFLTISLCTMCRDGQYFSHPLIPVFLILCHVLSQLVLFLHGSLYMLSLHLFFSWPLLLLPETSSLSDFAQMWLRSRLKQWPNHFSLLFSRKVSTGFTCTSFLMSSFLMWSNLVFPLAHLKYSQHPHFGWI